MFEYFDEFAPRYSHHRMKQELERLKEVATAEVVAADAKTYSGALRAIKAGAKMRREEWRPNKWVQLAVPETGLSYLEMELTDGRRAPYTPSRCDQFTDDWINASALQERRVEEPTNDSSSVPRMARHHEIGWPGTFRR